MRYARAIVPLAFPEPAASMLQRLACHGTFEAHITVGADPDRREVFTRLCAELGVGCVLIELAAGETPSQPMTASHHRGDLASVLAEVEEIHAKLERGGFSVVRVKLEAVDTNSGVPLTDDEARAFAAPGTYFEFHAKLRLSNAEAADLGRLRDVCRRHGAHLSRNDFRRDAQAGTSERFVTLRVHGRGRAGATELCDALVEDLRSAGHAVAGVKRELTIYDSHARLDAGWIEAQLRERDLHRRDRRDRAREVAAFREEDPSHHGQHLECCAGDPRGARRSLRVRLGLGSGRRG